MHQYFFLPDMTASISVLSNSDTQVSVIILPSLQNRLKTPLTVTLVRMQTA
jgi:hypothetical protein